MTDTSKVLVLENTSRRDELIDIEKRYQKKWAEAKLFEVDAPHASDMNGEELRAKYPKHFSSMAYPYMNGVLHAGHCFTLSKVEFATGFERMIGRRALFPLGFHCTGMPIKACADKLVREVEQFGKNFENAPKEEETQEQPAAPTQAKEKTDPTKFVAKKSKAQAKQGRGKFQFEIMMQSGIPREEVHKFANPNYWVEFFPPLCQEDCNKFGARIDWRRSFVTTDVNPYYDAFVRWQMNTLKALGKIKFGLRYTIYSAKDGQPCMDHDRQVGEAVNPQEYTGIKIKVLEWPQEALSAIESAGKKSELLSNTPVYLVAATLRPETMYGQTCCFVSPKITYGIFNAGEGNGYYICTERAFKNMSFQNLTPERGVYDPVMTMPGSALIGAKIKAPLSVYPELRVLPMETVLASKGTGVVTSVPSDSPDDFVTCRDLQNKPEYYKVEKEWASLDPVEIIETPSYGKLTAPKLVEDLKIKSPKDKDALAQAKELAYKEGFYQGIMVIGKYKGEKVEDAKAKVKADLIESKEAFVYNEPEGLVISRSGDECVVSLQDQWYTDYGEENWRKDAEECLENMNTYSVETKHGFQKTLSWLRNWALSRSFGLGTKIPWDQQYLVESLSDSTAYMAYYTICHLLHSDFYGREKGPLNISAEQMIDSVWDYVFQRIEYSESISKESGISKESLDKMRTEFEYFYPVDCRVSGKDLIPNHLTFFIYAHTALFPKKFWPRGIRANGHLLLNGEKMSKSVGNFMTLSQVVAKYGADAARIALADAGDTFEDANFDESNANAAILRLYILKEWMEEMTKETSLRTGPESEYNFYDRAFAAEMDSLIETTTHHYQITHYKAALKAGLFDFQAARDYYRECTTVLGQGMHKDLVQRYIESQVLLLAPVAPHFCDYIWNEVLQKDGSVHNAKFPVPAKPIDKEMLTALNYVRNLSRTIREAEGAAIKKGKKGKKGAAGPEFDPKKPTKLAVYIATAFPDWQEQYIELVRQQFESSSLEFTPEFRQKVSKLGDVKRGMQFVNHLKTRLSEGEPAENVFNRQLVFDEIATAKTVAPLLQKSALATKVEQLIIVGVTEKDGVYTGTDILTGETVDVPKAKNVVDAVPGSPAAVVTNVE